MKFEPKKDIKRIIIVCLAAVIMALNIKIFRATGGINSYRAGSNKGFNPCFLHGMGELFFSM